MPDAALNTDGCGILVVDDDRDYADAQAEVLELNGYQPIVAYSSYEALEAVATSQPKVALLDNKLDRSKGVDLIPKLKAACPGIMCVIVTGFDTTDAAIDALRQGAEDFLRKPLAVPEVLRCIESCLTRHRLVEERDQAILALEESEARTSGILAIAPDAIIAADRAGRIRIFNQGASVVFGYTEAEILNQPLDTLIPERFRQIHGAHVSAFVDGEDQSRRMGLRGDICGLRKDGVEFPAEASISKLELDDDVLFTVMLHDVSDRKKSEAEILMAKEEAVYANRAKSEFLANMSHELRTPLNAILGFSQLLEKGIGGELNKTQAEYVRAVADSGDLLLSLINDILDLSKLEAGKAEIEEETISVAETIDKMMVFVRSRAEDGGVGLEADFAEDLPLLRADERMVRQMVLNLLSNAVKFTTNGGRVDIYSSQRPDGGLAIEISDNGIGMARGTLPKALSQFGQLDGDLERRHEGTGLGLPLVKALIELHGGVLELESELGIGTTARLIFPPGRVMDVG